MPDQANIYHERNINVSRLSLKSGDPVKGPRPRKQLSGKVTLFRLVCGTVSPALNASDDTEPDDLHACGSSPDDPEFNA